MIISLWRASLTKTVFWSLFLQILWSICDKNFNLVRPALQFSPQKCHNWSKNDKFFDTRSKFWYFCISYKRNGYFYICMKWMFTFKNFRNVYWHGKQHSALALSNKSLPVLYFPSQYVLQICKVLWYEDTSLGSLFTVRGEGGDHCSVKFNLSFVKNA